VAYLAKPENYLGIKIFSLSSSYLRSYPEMASTESTVPDTRDVADAAPPAPAPAPALDPTTQVSTEPTAVTESHALKETTGTPGDDEERRTSPLAQLWDVAQAHSHPEIWGVTLADPETHVPTQIVLQKYLNANDGDFDNAKSQLIKTLDWRAKMQPLELLKKPFSKTKFGSLGFVTTYEVSATGSAESESSSEEIFNWNIYGGVNSIDETFGDLGQYVVQLQVHS
jgi:hypothetical protein